jgi:ribosomal protein L37AE/L43A
MWDVFISHASEDKDNFVRPFAVALRRLGLSVWYDEFSLELGDSLSRSVDKGIASSRFGLVVISQSFIAKAWPEYEIRGLVTQEISGANRILPVWHGVGRADVAEFSPSLADKVAIRTAELSASDAAIQVLAIVRPDLYEKHPRAELEKLATGEAFQKLQEEFDSLQEQLAEYQCPFCAAPVVERISAPADMEEKHWDLREIFECGYTVFGGQIEQVCPNDTRFPAFTDYSVHCELIDKRANLWMCAALPKTEFARKLRISPTYGHTEDEARSALLESYGRLARKRM